MAMTLKELEHEARNLARDEKAELLRSLIEDLDGGDENDVEAVWAEEAQRRYDAYKKGETTSLPAEQAFAKAWRQIEP